MKVESYEVLVPGIPEDFIPEHKEIRYRIIDEKNGSVLDDAQGYGYKSARNAYKSFGYKTKTEKKVNKKFSPSTGEPARYKTKAEKKANKKKCQSIQKALEILKIKKESDLFFYYKCLRQDLQREPTEKELKENANIYYREFYIPYQNLLKNCQNETEIISILEKIDKEYKTDLVSRYKKNSS